MAAVRFDGVTKRFGHFVAVRDLTLAIADGEFLVLVGPSGSGKTTVLRMLAGLERVTAGDVWIGDRRVNDVAAKDRDIAMVFQSYALYPHMSVYDNMAFGLRLRGVARQDVVTRVSEAAEILGISALLDRKPGQLSGGERQRVALGRAIVRQPAAFLLDEPLSNLDAKLRVNTRAEISRLHRRLCSTFVYVTHDQVEAMTMAERIAVMDRGILQQVGTPQELYNEPSNQFVAGFIGSPSMNFFDARVARGEGGPSLELGDLIVPTEGRLADALQDAVGRRVTLGLRPENVHDPEFPPRGVRGAALEATIDVTEPMGSEVIAHCMLAGATARGGDGGTGAEDAPAPPVRAEEGASEAHPPSATNRAADAPGEVPPPSAANRAPDALGEGPPPSVANRAADAPGEGPPPSAADRSAGSSGVRFLARLDPRSGLLPGARAPLLFDLERAHVFDDETGESLRPRG